MIDDILPRIANLKAELDRLRPLRGGAIAQLRQYYDVELTYTSNAIEGNTLTHRETAEVIEHGITVGGKPLRDHLEALDHYAAVQWVHDIAQGDVAIDETLVVELHRRIVARSAPDIAGSYSIHPRRIAGSAAVFPNPVKIPALMADFGDWLSASPPQADAAFEAHYRLTALHPFSDGNGRTARLLMSLMLLRSRYPPMAVRPQDRSGYLEALEAASLTGDTAAFRQMMHQRLLDTLIAYVAALG